LLWSLKIIISLLCAWRLLLNRLPTMINLDRKGMQLGNVQCPLCQGVETAQHLFNTCKVVPLIEKHHSTSVYNDG